jgi:hypothetical protein
MLEAASQVQNGVGSEQRDCGSSLLAEKEEYPLVTGKRKLDRLRFAVFAQSDARKVSKRMRADFVFFLPVAGRARVPHFGPICCTS